MLRSVGILAKKMEVYRARENQRGSKSEVETLLKEIKAQNFQLLQKVESVERGMKLAS